MSSQRKQYTQEFKDQVVREALETKNTVLVARQYNIASNMLNRWIREHKNPACKKSHNTTQPTGNNNNAYKSLETENQTLKRLLGEKDLQIAILEDLLKKTNRR